MAKVTYLVAQALFLSICLVLIIVNVKHAHGCHGAGYDGGDAAARRTALERRLVAMETEAAENAALLHDFLVDVDLRFGIAGMMDLRAMKRECHDEAARIVAHLAEDAPPPMPAFARPADEFSAGSAADGYADDLFAAERYDYGESESGLGFGGVVDGAYGFEDLPSTEERSATCAEWRTKHAVSPGVSWGTLPLDLQGKWRDYDCDIFLQDAAQGMLADGPAHADRAKQNAAKPKLDDLFADDAAAVGDVSSLDHY